jgi:hypothetical protein
MVNLNNGFKLIPFDNDNNYSHLYKDGKQVSTEIFRKGGMCTGFTDGYCILINYTIEKDGTWGLSSGTFVVVNSRGEIVKYQKSTLTYIYHRGGCIISEGDEIFCLKTNKIIMKKSGSIMRTENYLFAQEGHKGPIYKIEIATGNYEIIN